MNAQSPIVKQGSIAPLKNVSACLDVANRIINRKPGVAGLGVFSGPSGYGKSKASLYVQHKKSALYLEVFNFWTRKLFVEALLAELGVHEPRGSIGTMMLQAIRLLRDDPNRLLIIDEADQLVDRHMIELVRDIYKAADIPVLLVGEEQLPAKLSRYERVENRVSAFALANPCDAADARVLAQAYYPRLSIADDLLAHVADKTQGVASQIVATLGQVEEFCLGAGVTTIDFATYGGGIFTGKAPTRRAVR